MTATTAATAQAIDDVAAALLAAARTRTPRPPIKEMLPPNDVVAAYRVQAKVTERALADGRRLVGRKIGLTSVAVQKQLGVDQPDFGMLFDDMAFTDGETIPWNRLLQPKVEAEVAIVLERDLDREGLMLTDVIAATAYALPAIEIVGSRIAEWKISLIDTIADNASSGVYVIGTVPRKLEAFDPRLCGMVMTRRGEAVSLGVGAACLGNPMIAALWLARKMVEVGAPLKAGDLVLTGALGPMVVVAPGDSLRAEIGGLGSVEAVFGRDE
ncbi:MAG: fumarylacetoacetate hydrolase family protein [Caldimonas sp.]